MASGTAADDGGAMGAKRLGGGVGLAMGLAAAVSAGLGAYASRRYFHDWGATKAECAAELPGDELVPGPADVTTRGVTVDAPAEDVWPWLVQLGQDRGGLYSYDRLENLVGLHIHSADEIRREWQHLTEGDEVRLVPRGWFGLADGLALAVARVEEGRSVVLRQLPPAQPFDGVWSFHVRPVTETTCRLVSRSRTVRADGPRQAAAEVLDAVVAFMTRRMLLGIKARAERTAARELLLHAAGSAPP